MASLLDGVRGTSCDDGLHARRSGFEQASLLGVTATLLAVLVAEVHFNA